MEIDAGRPKPSWRTLGAQVERPSRRKPHAPQASAVAATSAATDRQPGPAAPPPDPTDVALVQKCYDMVREKAPFARVVTTLSALKNNS